VAYPAVEVFTVQDALDLDRSKRLPPGGVAFTVEQFRYLPEGYTRPLLTDGEHPLDRLDISVSNSRAFAPLVALYPIAAAPPAYPPRLAFCLRPPDGRSVILAFSNWAKAPMICRNRTFAGS